MTALFYTSTKTSAFGAAAPAAVRAHVRDRLTGDSIQSGSTLPMSDGRNAGDVHALVARCLR
jgi:hypothetical protein